MNQAHQDLQAQLDHKVNLGYQDTMECKVGQVIQEIKGSLAHLEIQVCLDSLGCLDPKVIEELARPWVWGWAWVWELVVTFPLPLLRAHLVHLEKRDRLVEMVGMVSQVSLVLQVKEENVVNQAGMVTAWVEPKVKLVHQDLKAKLVLLGTQVWMVYQELKAIRATKA